ncbi:hydrogenase maturation nickel metallochaperone HypA [Verrucomicrobiota bacterium]
MKKRSAAGNLYFSFLNKMHEFSICQTLVDDVLKEFGKVKNQNIHLKKVRMNAGQYHRFVPASLKMAYKILTKNTPAEGSSLLVKTIPIKLKCRQCGWEGSIRDIGFICRKCGGVETDITAGKELSLESIEVESN